MGVEADSNGGVSNTLDAEERNVEVEDWGY